VKVEQGLTASVKARLQNKARETNRPFNDLLQLFGIERFLYRLSCSPYADQFILKGALMLLAFDIPSLRPTRDIDLLGCTSNDVIHIVEIFQQICTVDVEPDGITFDLNSVNAHRIKEDADYEGVRVLLRAYLGKAVIPIQVDIGFSDVLTPAPVQKQYPTLLSLPAPQISGYPLETIVAEKLQAMVFLGRINSRMKDFYDLWILTTNIDFDSQSLQKAILRTFRHRNTPIPEDVPAALTDLFAEEKQAQWKAFLKRSRLEASAPEFPIVTGALRSFLIPHLRVIADSPDTATKAGTDKP